jgi:murein DD-endopeptidase MepM/ murein hydrolase activator NlpD
MSEGRSGFKRGVTVVYILFIHVLAVAFVVERFVLPRIRLTDSPPAAVSDPTTLAEVPTPLPVPSEFYEPPVENSNVNAALGSTDPQPAPPSSGGPLQLIIPVAGIKSEQLQDTFTASRSGGRVHDAIDIMAPVGAPVLAAADGKIFKFHDSVPGGITIYELSTDGKYVYYYAHLQKRADGLKEGDFVRQGTTIGYVGDTGNAGPGNYHLHFSLFEVTDPKRLWQGNNINPYPLLKNAPR